MSINLTKSKGFTLLELGFILVIIGVLSAIATMSWTDTPARLTAEAQRLKTNIRYVQMLSMARHEMYQINFLNSTQYSITETNGITPVYFPGSNENITTLDTGLTIASSASPIIFNSFGVPYRSVSTPQTRTAMIFITASDGSTATLTVSPETGYATIT